MTSSRPGGSRHVDGPRSVFYAEFMELRVPPELEAKLNRLAAETGCNAEQLALGPLAGSGHHDEWFRNEVEKVRVSVREGRLLDHDDVALRGDRRYRR